MTRGPTIRAWLLGLLFVAGLGVAIFNYGEMQRFAQLVQRAEPAWLAVAFVLQLCTYVCVAASWNVVLRAAGSPQPLGSLILLSISKLFADQAIPTAGMSGNLLLVDRLTAAGVPRAHAATAMLLSIAGYYLEIQEFAVHRLAPLAVTMRREAKAVITQCSLGSAKVPAHAFRAGPLTA